MMNPVARRAAEDRMERAVCELVVAALEAEGRDVQVLGRPDVENRTGPAADFLLLVDGEEIALEVTRTASTAEQRKALLSGRLTERLHEELDEEIARLRAGHAFVHFELTMAGGESPPRRVMEAAAPAVAERIRGGLRTAIATRERVDLDDVGPVTDLSLSVQPTAMHRLSVTWGVGGGFIEPLATAAVRRVIAGKTDQLARYRRVFLALLEPTGFLDPEDIGEAFGRAEAPENWQRAYVIDRGPTAAVLAWERDANR